MKKKFKVIHYSDNWVYGPSIQSFDTAAEAEKHIKDFKGNNYHKEDSAEVVEVLGSYETKEIDRTEDTGPLFGLKETK